MGIEQWSQTANNNVNSKTGINWDEGMAPSAVNDSARSTLAAVREWYDDAEWIKLGENGSANAFSISYVSATLFKFPGTDRRSLVPVGRRVKAGVGAGTIYGTISDTSLSASDTQVTVSFDSGNLDSSLSYVSLGILSASNNSMPRGLNVTFSDVTATGAANIPGVWQLIATYTPSATASQAVTGFDSTKYSDYEIVIDRLIPATDNVTLYARTSTDGGSNYDAGASDYAWVALLSGSQDVDAADSEIQITGSTVAVGNATDEVLSGRIFLINPEAAAQFRMTWQCGFTDASPLERVVTGSGRRLASANVDAIQFLFSSGNITSGTIRFYGRRK